MEQICYVIFWDKARRRLAGSCHWQIFFLCSLQTEFSCLLCACHNIDPFRSWVVSTSTTISQFCWCLWSQALKWDPTVCCSAVGLRSRSWVHGVLNKYLCVCLMAGRHHSSGESSLSQPGSAFTDAVTPPNRSKVNYQSLLNFIVFPTCCLYYISVQFCFNYASYIIPKVSQL